MPIKCLVAWVLRKRSWVAGEEEEMKSRTPRTGLSESARRLFIHISEDFVKIELQGNTKQEVIKELVSKCAFIYSLNTGAAPSIRCHLCPILASIFSGIRI